MENCLTVADFAQLRYGLFVHYGLYSQLGRGEWARNREGIAAAEYEALARSFSPSAFDAMALCRLAVAGGMRYIVFTTMHHDGFRLYDSGLSDFNSVRRCGRDLTAEIIVAARACGLRIALYHSLNNWQDDPDAVQALESPEYYQRFIDHTFARLQELVSRYAPIDVLWYDGWWPFNDEGWQSERMNAALRAIQPWLLFNGRNALPGDFGTPEQHLTPPSPWRPWEACVTLNDHWGYHAGDAEWKSPLQVVKMLLTCGNGRGNLLLNIGPCGDGRVPSESVAVIHQVGQWLRAGGWEAISNNDTLSFSPFVRQPGERGDWDHNGVFTASGNTLFFTVLYACGPVWRLNGLEATVLRVSCQQVGPLVFRQDGAQVQVELPEVVQGAFAPVLRLECDRPPAVYRSGGMRTPQVPHPRFDPISPDIAY